MKKLVALFFVGTSLVAMADVGAYHAIIRDGFNKSQCGRTLKQIRGVSNVNVLEAIGAVTFKATEQGAAAASQLNCLQYVEKDQVYVPAGL